MSFKFLLEQWTKRVSFFYAFIRFKLLIIRYIEMFRSWSARPREMRNNQAVNQFTNGSLQKPKLETKTTKFNSIQF